MEGIELWRARIGCFLQPGPRIKFKAPAIRVSALALRLTMWVTCLLAVQLNCDRPGGTVTWSGCMQVAKLLTIMEPSPLECCASSNLCGCYLWNYSDNMTFIQATHATVIMQRIQLCGDVELNPGPTETRLAQSKLSAAQGKLNLDTGITTTLNQIMKEIKESRVAMTEKIDELGVKLESKYQELKTDMSIMKQELDSTRKKLDDLENRSRRNNIVVYGVAESGQETWDNTEDKLCETLTENLAMDVTKDHFERVHRIGKRTQGKDRPIVAMCGRYKTKEQIIRAARDRKPDGLYINEDFSEAVRKERKALSGLMKTKRENELTAYLSYNKLIVKNTQGKQNIYQYDDNLGRIIRIKASFVEPEPSQLGRRVADTVEPPMDVMPEGPSFTDNGATGGVAEMQGSLEHNKDEDRR